MYFSFCPTKNPDAYKKGSVPEDFAASIKIYCSRKEDTRLTFESISTDYRTNPTSETALFFVDNILSKINPKVSNFASLRTSAVLSDIFTVTDEAFALVMVLNQLDNWKELSKPKGNRCSKKMKKLFTAPTSGGRQSWTAEGRDIYHAICREVEKLRADTIRGSTFEDGLLEYYQTKYNGNKKRRIQVEESTEVHYYEGDGLKDLLEEIDDGKKASV